MKIKSLTTYLLFFFLSACMVNNKPSNNQNPTNHVPIKEHTILAVLWQQNAAEYRSLCHQAFNIARLRLDELVAQSKSDKPLAIITDIDETILDNSPYATEMIVDDKNYDKDSWIAWGEREVASLVPGADDFINHASRIGVEVFYVSNRYESQLDATINNLKKFGLANADESHVLLKTTTSGKQQRRNKISQTHEVLLLLGDNLSDFDDVYDKQNTQQRNQHVSNMKALFGQKFIVFPNPTYGDWETKGIYEGKYPSDDEKRTIRAQKLRH